MIAGSLLKKRIVACANIVPGIISKFWWNGKIDRTGEVLLILKTKVRHFAALEREVKRLHSYEVPEVVALPIAAGSSAYLDWIGRTVRA